MKRLWAKVAFLGFYICEIVRSNLRVAHDVLTPRHRMTPAIIGVDVDGMSESQVARMANLITMTPGTLGVALSGDNRVLYIHCMYVDGSPGELASSLQDEYGRRVRRAFR